MGLQFLALGIKNFHRPQCRQTLFHLLAVSDDGDDQLLGTKVTAGGFYHLVGVGRFQARDQLRVVIVRQSIQTPGDFQIGHRGNGFPTAG